MHSCLEVKMLRIVIFFHLKYLLISPSVISFVCICFSVITIFMCKILSIQIFILKIVSKNDKSICLHNLDFNLFSQDVIIKKNDFVEVALTADYVTNLNKNYKLIEFHILQSDNPILLSAAYIVF